MFDIAYYNQYFSPLLDLPVYDLPQAEKEALLLPVLNALHEMHCHNNQQYNRLKQFHTQQSCNPESINGKGFKHIADLPYVAVRLFKHLELSSIPAEDVFKVLQSSGTTGQTPARVLLDRETSARQSKVLVKILQQTIGKQRLPMLIMDSPAVLKDRNLFSARGAGIQGLSFFGRDHTFALQDDMRPNWQAIRQFAEKYNEQPVLIFGFTYMLWLYFIQPLLESGFRPDFSRAVVLHSGGWKKLESEKVDNETFRQTLKDVCSATDVHNFYGMAEQVGSVFVECSEGHLHAPLFADIITRDPYTLAPCNIGQQGIAQVISSLPTSYPGYSLLTEDLATVLGVDDCMCGKKGKYFSIDGRLPKTEIRGCSDTHARGLA